MKKILFIICCLILVSTANSFAAKRHVVKSSKKINAVLIVKSLSKIHDFSYASRASHGVHIEKNSTYFQKQNSFHIKSSAVLTPTSTQIVGVNSEGILALYSYHVKRSLHNSSTLRAPPVKVLA